MLGEPERALNFFIDAIKRSPRDPAMGILQCSLGRSYVLLGRWDEAIDACLNARAKIPGDLLVHTSLAAALAQKGNMEQARSSLEDALIIVPQLCFTWLDEHHYSNEPAYLKLAEATLCDGLRKAGLPE
jgi:adenylate cyclase